MNAEDKRPCASCGAANPPGATHCWQCYARAAVSPASTPVGPLSASRAPPGAAGVPGSGHPEYIRPGSPPPPPVMSPPVSSGSTIGGAGTMLRVVLGLMIAAVAYVGVQRFMDRSVEIPESIAGTPRMHDALSKTFEEQMGTEAEKFDVPLEAAAFGRSGQAEFLLVVVNEAALETTDQLFQSFTRGFTEGGATVGADKSEGELKDASYRCVSANGTGVQVGTCMWRADRHVGIVLDLDGDLKSAEALTSQIYRAIG